MDPGEIRTCDLADQSVIPGRINWSVPLFDPILC